LSRELSNSRSRELSESGSVVPTPKSTRILLEPLLTRDCSGQSAIVSLDASSSFSDRTQLKSIERQLTLGGLSCA
jgi:hypothetical protein